MKVRSVMGTKGVEFVFSEFENDRDRLISMELEILRVIGSLDCSAITDTYTLRSVVTPFTRKQVDAIIHTLRGFLQIVQPSPEVLKWWENS